MIAKSIIAKEDADNIAVTFSPKKFPMRITPNAVSFHKIQSGENRNDFRIEHLVSESTGVGELERLSIEEKVEQQALSKVKEMQEDAYKQGFELGRTEGAVAGFEEYKADITTRLEGFDQLLMKVENLKAQLVNHNEVYFIKLLYQMATKIAMSEISEKPETIISVLREVTETAQSDQKMNVKLAPSDFKFITDSYEQLSRNFEFLKNLKLEAAPELSAGGCKIETNYGSINATIEQRVAKLWENLAQKVPRAKDEVGDET